MKTSLILGLAAALVAGSMPTAFANAQVKVGATLSGQVMSCKNKPVGKFQHQTGRSATAV
ncbi:hypothetical protein [Lamprocystis purpurea]|jgi:hypothetical protein|uniref:hypothetical protein n=1 Tax=Lamprocystis purpurea TaxID=61598 RepID=UPI000368AE6D|nr:hypothetical protein [Lamprocystis purpurea]